MEWQDIESILTTASSTLELGELLHGEEFCLHRTMTAVVVGSTRMDTVSGEDCEDPIKLSEAATTSLRSLSFEEKLYVMDKLLTLQASYHQGTGLGRSVYTCLYLFNLPRVKVEDPLLYEFCTILTMLCTNIRDLILDARVCEDEDFNVLTQGLPLPSSSQSIDDSKTKREQLLESFISKPNSTPEIEGLTVLMARGLVSRLRFVKSLLLGLKCIAMRTKVALVEASRYFTNAETELKTILSTQELKKEITGGFHSKLNTSGHHMRFSNVLTEEEAWSHFKDLLEDLKLVTTIVYCGSYREIKSFIMDFSDRHSGAIARSALYLQLDDRRYQSSQEQPRWIPNARMLSEVFGISLKQLPTIGKEARYFLEQAMIGIQNWICCLCLNSYRQRRRLKRGLEDWKRLYDHALAADKSEEFQTFIQSNGWNWKFPYSASTNEGIFTTWVEKESCLVMSRHLCLGFEQELYHPNEFLSIYWYSDYLLTRVIICSKELYEVLPSTLTTTSKKQKKAHQQSEIIRNQKHSSDLALLELERSLCQGLTRVMLALRSAKIIDLPPLPFSEELNRFEQRFLPFWVVERPEPVDFASYHASISTGRTDPNTLLLMATRFFTLAKDNASMMIQRGMLSSLSERNVTRVHQLEKVAKTNQLASRLLEKFIESGAKIKIKFHFEIDRYIPSLAISS